MQCKTTPHRRKDPHDGRGLSNALQTRRFGVWFLLGNKKDKLHVRKGWMRVGLKEGWMRASVRFKCYQWI